MKLAQTLMVMNIVVGLLIVFLASTWPMVVAAHIPDAALTPDELQNPVVMQAVTRATIRYGNSQTSLPYIALGLLLCGLNLYGSARLMSESTRESDAGGD